MAEMHVLDAIEEKLAEEEEEKDWNWEALAKFVNTRWGLNLRDRDLKREGRDLVAQVITDKARESINRATSRPFDNPRSGRIAVKVIHHLGDEVMKVFRVG